MGIQLTKGQKISLTKEGGGALNEVAVGLGWGKRRAKGWFGGEKLKSVDLDASVIMFDSSKSTLDAVSFQQLRSRDGSVLHTGDDLVGGGSEQEPNEVINVKLRDVPSNVASLVFVVNSYSGETFDGIPFAFCNVVDRSNNNEIGRYNLTTEGGSYKGFIIAKVYRHGDEWKFHAIGSQLSGTQRTWQHAETDARSQA